MIKPGKKQRLSIYLDPPVMAALVEHAARRDLSRSLVAEAASAPSLSPAAGAPRGGANDEDSPGGMKGGREWRRREGTGA